LSVVSRLVFAGAVVSEVTRRAACVEWAQEHHVTVLKQAESLSYIFDFELRFYVPLESIAASTVVEHWRDEWAEQEICD